MTGLSNTDRMVLYGLLAFIAWELWQPSGLAEGGPSGACAPPVGAIGASIASPWIQQLSGEVTGQDVFTPQCGMFGRCS